jgi:hypothetical protein
MARRGTPGEQRKRYQTHIIWSLTDARKGAKRCVSGLASEPHRFALLRIRPNSKTKFCRIPKPHRFALLRPMRANDSARNRTASQADAGKRFGPEPHRFTLLRPDAGK